MTKFQREDITPGTVLTFLTDSRWFTVEEFPSPAGYFAITRHGSAYGRSHLDEVAAIRSTGDHAKEN